MLIAVRLPANVWLGLALLWLPLCASAQSFNELNPDTTWGVTINSNDDSTSNGEYVEILDKTERVFYGESGVVTEVRNDEGNVSLDAGDNVTIRVDGDSAGGGDFVVEDYDGAGFVDVMRANEASTTLSSDSTTITGNADVDGSFDVDGATTTDGIDNAGQVETDTLLVNSSSDLDGNLDVDGFTNTDGIDNVGQVETDTLLVNSSSDLDGNLDVDGFTNTDGIDNAGQVETDTLLVNSSSDLDGDLDVDGFTNTDGIANTGNIATTTLGATGLISGTGGIDIGGGTSQLTSADTRTDVTVNDSGATLTRNPSAGVTSTVDVDDSSVTLSRTNGGTTNSLVVGDTQTASIGANSFDFGTEIDGGALVNGDLGVNGSIYALNPNANVGVNISNNGLDIEGASNTVSLIADSNNVDVDGRGQVVLQENVASVQVYNSETGHHHGLSVHEKRTVLSGGTTSTNLTLDDRGATFDDDEGGPARVRGVADGRNRYDAVNHGQLKDVEGGVASVAALAAIPAAERDKTFSLGIGGGTFAGEHAYALGASLRMGRHVVMKGGAAQSPGKPWAGSVGFSLSW